MGDGPFEAVEALLGPFSFRAAGCHRHPHPTGARVSEAVGLKWQFVDLEATPPRITTAGKIVDSKGQAKRYEAYLKSEAGWGSVAIPVEIVPMLRRRRLAGGGNEFVFHTRTGAPNGTQDVHRAPEEGSRMGRP